MNTLQEQASGFGMRGDTLQESETVAHPIRLVGCECGRIDGRIDADHLLQQGRYGAERMPQHGRQILHGLPLPAQLDQRVLARARHAQLVDPLVDLLRLDEFGRVASGCRHRCSRHRHSRIRTATTCHFGQSISKNSNPLKMNILILLIKYRLLFHLKSNENMSYSNSRSRNLHD